jgi:hypothetical protein
MSVSINNLTLLTFFHVFFSKFSDILHNEDDIFIFESMNSFFNCIFFELNKIKIHA